jgi:hypothetical protein
VANPTEGPFDPAAPLPQSGDPEILPRGEVTRPSKERMPFGPSGELLNDGPAVPEDFLQAPDIEGLPWTRKRGEEWTDATFRQATFDFLIDFFRTRSWAYQWTVRERSQSERMSAHKLPPDQYYLVIGIVRKSDGQRFETSAEFPRDKRDAVSARVILDLMAATLDTLQAQA